MKKSQVQSQIFVYILSIIIVALILLYGYKAISHFTGRTEQISYVKFKTDLESHVRIISTDYGSVSQKEFGVGSNYKEVCFIDSDAELDNGKLDELHPIIKQYIEGGSDKNVFLIGPGDSVKESFDVGTIDVGVDEFSCIPVTRGKVKIQFEGLGNRTRITTW